MKRAILSLVLSQLLRRKERQRYAYKKYAYYGGYRPKPSRQWLWLAGFAGVGMVLFVGVGLWIASIAVSGLSSGISRLTSLETGQFTQQILERPVVSAACLETVQGMLTSTSLLTRAPQESYEAFAGACLSGPSSPAGGGKDPARAAGSASATF